MSSYQRFRRRRRHKKKVANVKVANEKTRRDVHHLLFQGRHFANGYAKRLRDHWYFKVRIPQETTHRTVHSLIHDIVVPTGDCCKSAYLHLIEAEKADAIHATDTPQQRLTWLIQEWKNEPKAEVTVAELIYQRYLFDTYYHDNYYLKKQQEL